MLLGMVGVGWGAVTLDDVAKDITAIKIDLAALKTGMGGLKDSFDGLRGLVSILFTAMAALLAGLFYFVFDISRSLRVPKEERVAKLEEMMGRMRGYLDQVSDKLHLPKPLL
jgi:hypothetical protein